MELERIRKALEASKGSASKLYLLFGIAHGLVIPKCVTSQERPETDVDSGAFCCWKP